MIGAISRIARPLTVAIGSRNDDASVVGGAKNRVRPSRIGVGRFAFTHKAMAL